MSDRDLIRRGDVLTIVDYWIPRITSLRVEVDDAIHAITAVAATQRDPRDEVIVALVGALEDVVKNENWLVNQKFKGKSEWFDLSMQRAALAAAKEAVK